MLNFKAFREVFEQGYGTQRGTVQLGEVKGYLHIIGSLDGDRLTMWLVAVNMMR